jgi:aminoglycoside phosphotransferase (APT) family kinase protein
LLAKAVAGHLQESADSISLQPIATGKFNSSYFVSAGGRQWVLRVAPPDDAVYVFYERAMMRQEPELHAVLRAETTVPVARVHAFDTERSVIDRDFIVMERLPGRPMTEAAGVNEALVLGQLGAYLAQTHRITSDEYGYLGAHRPMVPESSWAGAFVKMWDLLIDDVVAVGFYDPAESAGLRGLLREHLALFDREVASSLLHMDVWQQNILVDEDSTVTGLIDWDRALWGDPEIEFAVLDYCGISQPAFWEGYGRPRDMSVEASIRQTFYLLYELQKYIVIEQGRRDNPAKAQRYKEQTLELIRVRLGPGSV